ncbi:MAG: 5-(carboxyamino)imidazole ribonucleotide synthase, partial [Hyphomicrobiaceae bacterium]|nr:5-(carboxyamino)imidazole ribonucleotide synthase [Hyphomicrobiaceae bacterium]
GIVGGGQLGRMLAMAAARLGLRTAILTPKGDTPAVDVAGETVFCESYDDADALKRFAGLCDIITYEFENIPVAAIAALSAARPMRPGARSLEMTCDRLTEKRFIEGLGIPVAPFAPVETRAELDAALATIGTPAILKTRRLGYDGKGQARILKPADAESAFAALAGAPAVLEGFIDFDCEISVVLTRDPDGRAVTYDVAENAHRGGILATSTVPASIREGTAAEARKAALVIAEALGHIGTLAVEFFVTPAGGLIVNEIAPRVHNSGHWTLDACTVSQFENHIRAVAGWPLGDTARHSNAVMENLIGAEADGWEGMASARHAALHLYGKAESRPGRKMGHLTRLFPRLKSS